MKCKYCGIEIKINVKQHEQYCKLNPERLKSRPNFIPWNKGKTMASDERLIKSSETLRRRYKNGEILPSFLGHKHSEENKKILSEKQKLAHKEGRAWNIGKSRWNNEKSWPEKFFMEVIQNEFVDKDVKTEYPVSIYSLDFAWIHKKKCIEIDGKQHEQREYKERDARKDSLLIERGWKIMRIPWSQMYGDTKTWIAKAKQFIDE